MTSYEQYTDLPIISYVTKVLGRIDQSELFYEVFSKEVGTVSQPYKPTKS